MVDIDRHFTLQQSDGVHGAQVLIYDKDDLDYWRDECVRKNYRMVFSFHVDANAFHDLDLAHDVYQAIPN